MRIPAETPAGDHSGSHSTDFDRHLRSHGIPQHTPTPPADSHGPMPFPNGGNEGHGWPSSPGDSGWHGWPSPPEHGGWHGWPPSQSDGDWHSGPLSHGDGEWRAPSMPQHDAALAAQAENWRGSAAPYGDARVSDAVASQDGGGPVSPSGLDPYRVASETQLLCRSEGHDVTASGEGADHPAYAAATPGQAGGTLLGNAGADELAGGHGVTGSHYGSSDIAPENVILRNDIPVWAIQGYGGWQHRRRSAAWWRRRRWLQRLRRIGRLSRQQ